MKPFLILLIFFGFNLRAGETAGAECRVLLLNGDRIQGKYLGQDREMVLLKTDNAEGEIRIHGKYIDSLDFGMKKRVSDADYQVQFSPEQQVLGDVLLFSEGQMVLKTAWVDQLILDSSYLQKVEAVHQATQVIYRGPGNPERWVYSIGGSTHDGKEKRVIPKSAGQWVLAGQGELATTFPLINSGLRLKLVMEIPEVSYSESFAVVVNNFPAMEGMGNGEVGRIEITVNAREFRIDTVDGLLRGGRVFGQRKVPRGSMVRPQPGTIDLLLDYDLQNQRFRVKVGDLVIAEWQGSDEEPERKAYSPRMSFGWKFEPEHQVKIHDIYLSLRDQPLPEESVELPKDAEAVLFHNGDFLRVNWQGVDAQGNWKLALTDLDSETTMNPERIQMWLNQGARLKQMRRMAGHVEVMLSGGEERFIAELVTADSESFTLKREGWIGSYRIPIQLLEQVKFNPYY